MAFGSTKEHENISKSLINWHPSESVFAVSPFFLETGSTCPSTGNPRRRVELVVTDSKHARPHFPQFVYNIYIILFV